MAAELPAVDFDPALHSPARLKIMMILAVDPTASFNTITKLASLTPGNLGTHMKALEAAGYVETYHTLVDLKPRARYRMTENGRTALRAYCQQVSAALQGIQGLLPPAASDATRSPKASAR